MKYTFFLLLILVVPVLAQESDETSLAEVEATLQSRYKEIADSPETDALIQADTQALLRYRQVLAEHPEIQVVEAERLKAEEALTAAILAKDALEKALQKSDPEIRAAKEELDQARSAAEAVYQTEELLDLEAVLKTMVTEKSIREQQK